MKSYFDIAGDGGSDVIAQVEAQRRAVGEALAGVERTLAVASGKGGVGKSTLTLGLAWALARRGLRVAVLDADLNGPSQARLAGLEAVPWVPGGLDGRGLAMPRRPDGIGVVSMGSVLGAAAPFDFEATARGDAHTWRATREITLLGQLLGAVDWGELDLLLVDLPPGAERTLHHAELLAGLGPPFALVLVTIPGELAHGVVARSLTALERAGRPPLGYVENMAGYYCRGCGAVRPLFPAAASEEAGLAAERLGRVPFDPELAALCDRGWPPEAAAAAGGAALAAIDEIAVRLAPAAETRSRAPHPEVRE
jgi:ATP-binding protein involved in chromosome partitioning